jgi:small-conductance mechanosensitive channel
LEIFAIDYIKSDLRFAIDDAFRLNDISIPFPQRDLHIVSDKKTTYQPD